MKRSLALFIVSILLISNIRCLDVDPCKRQPFRGRCPVSGNGIQARSQFVLRYYLRNGECVSYPYGHCANDENEPKLFRYKEECQEACIGKRENESINRNDKDSLVRFAPTKTTTPGNIRNEETYQTNKPLDKISSPKILSECEKQRIDSKNVFKLECDSDGSYKQLQCNAEKQECFCVDENGKEIPYSRSLPTGVAPDCNAILTAEKKLFNKCTGKSVYGPCKANLSRWYFDEIENKCKLFQYSGCGSNGNNYENELACIDRCIPKKAMTSSEDESHTTTSQIDRNTVCSLPKERGPCEKYDLRFYFNKDLNECKYFFYGGCEGNANNFLKVEDCEATCGGKPSQIKELPPKNPINVTPEPKIFQTIQNKETPIQTLQSKETHFQTTFSPKPIPTTTEYPFTENRCIPPKDSGNCNGNFARWYWNNENKICESFSYSGCGGNSNNFANREECLSVCHINAVSKDDKAEMLDPFDVCSHKIDPGECGGSFLRWAFDKKTKTCVKMFYTGCQGNGNNFATEDDCARKCIPGRKPPQQSSACFHPIDVGDCDGVFPRFGYDRNTNECKQYTYSGCNGSPNNFGTYQDCAEACIRTPCPPMASCDLSRCHVIHDLNGCPSCNCPPINNKNPIINPPPLPVPTSHNNNCPIVDAASCLEPCMIFFNRVGCQECVCPKVPTTEKPPVKLPTNLGTPVIRNDVRPLPTLKTQEPKVEEETTTFQPSTRPLPVLPKKNEEDINSINNGFPSNSLTFKDVVGDKCTLPVDPGPCKDFIERWYFNINTGICEPFKFGGCGGSKNHFFTRHECEVHCARFSNITSLAHIKSITTPQPNIIKPPPLPILHSQNKFNNVIPIPPKIIIKPFIKNNKVNNITLKNNNFDKVNGENNNFNKSSIPTSTYLKIPVVVNVIKKIQKEEEKRPVDIVEDNDSEETIEIKQQLVSRGVWIPESMVTNTENFITTSINPPIEKSTQMSNRDITSTVKVNLPDQSLEILGNPNNRLMWIKDINTKTGVINKIKPEEIRPPFNGAIGSVMWVKRWNHKLKKYELINPNQYTFEEYQRRLRLGSNDNLQTVKSSSTANFIPQWTTSNPNIIENSRQFESLLKVDENMPKIQTFDNQVSTITPQRNKPPIDNFATISFDNNITPNQNPSLIPTPEQFPLDTINSGQKPIVINDNGINNKTNDNSQVMWINVWNEETQKKEIIGISKDLLQKSTTRIVLESVTLAPGKVLKPPTSENISPLIIRNQTSAEKEIVSNFINNYEKSQKKDNISKMTFLTTPIESTTISTSQQILIDNDDIDSTNSILLNSNKEPYLPENDISEMNLTISSEKFTTKPATTINAKVYKPAIFATKIPDISPLVTIFEELIIADDSIYYKTSSTKKEKIFENHELTTTTSGGNRQIFTEKLPVNYPIISNKSEIPNLITKNIQNDNKKTEQSEELTTKISKILVDDTSVENKKTIEEEVLTTEISKPSTIDISFENTTPKENNDMKLDTQTYKPMSTVYIKSLPFEKDYKSLNIENVKKDNFITSHTSTDAPFIEFTKGLSTKQSTVSQQTRPTQKKILKPQSNNSQLSRPLKQSAEEIVDICNLPADAGHCFNYIPRWYFNSQKGKCEQFSYGSCGGNKNNFFDRNSCEAECSSVILPKVFPSLPKECTFERDEGFGGQYHPKYYFNFRNLHCEQMIYQGQGGNGNRFDNKIKCENKCIRRIHEEEEEDSIKPLPVQQKPKFVPLPKDGENWGKETTNNLLNNNVKGIKIAESVDNQGKTGRPLPIQVIRTENSQLNVSVPSLESYQQQYNAREYQTKEDVSTTENHLSSVKVQSTIVPDNGGYPEMSLVPSQSTQATTISQNIPSTTTIRYETAESTSEKEVKPLTTEVESTPYEIETTTVFKNVVTEIEKVIDEIKPSESNILTLSTRSPISISTIGFETKEPTNEVVLNTVPTIKVVTYTDTPTTEKQTLPTISTFESSNTYSESTSVGNVESELSTESQTKPSITQSQTEPTTSFSTETPVQIQTKSSTETYIQPQTSIVTQTQPTTTTEIESIPNKVTEFVETVSSSTVPINIPSSVDIRANLTVQAGSSPSISETKIISKIAEIEDITTDDRSIKKLDIRPISPTSTIKDLSTEATTIKLETPTTSKQLVPNQPIEDDKDLLESQEFMKKDAIENRDEYKADKLTEKIINKVPKEQLPIVKESPDPKIDYQNRGGNVMNGISNLQINKDTQIMEELTPTINPRIPVCPNKKSALLDRTGSPLSCLPGKRPCPDRSSCIYNGVNFYCCPSPEDPYDHHVFGGYNGEEIKNGYKPLTKTLNIFSIVNNEPIKRAKRDSMGLENVYKSLRFEGAPIKQVSRANRLHVNGKMLPICSLEVERGNCEENHVRYFYDARIDQCRMFYYSGCQGNGNNFATQKDCERICKIEESANSKISKEQKSFVDVCGEGKMPFGGENPLVCGNENDSIGCPVGYTCRKEAPFICCPKIIEDVDDSNQLTIKDIIAKKNSKDTRFAPQTNSPYNPYKSNLPRLRTQSGIVIASSSNICPDGSDSLKEVMTGKPVDCGTGGDGHPLCPIGYYCSMDSFTNSRLCCQLGSIGTKLHAPVNESPFINQKKNNSKELSRKQELPVSDGVSSTTPQSPKPLPIAIPSIKEKKNNLKEYDHMMIKPVNKGNNQNEILLEENPKLLVDDTQETNLKHTDDSSILMVDEIAMLEPKKVIDKNACQVSPSEGRGCREDEPMPRTNLQYFYSVKDKKCKLFFYRGCGGSINRFESKKACEALCMMD
uniref:Kunitz/Bovine pancreatic trypsin inhibitor domain protein n=1 Tax=Strongyloides papillosus TaxID=174720 RepID=A0A0N5BFF6_STREA